MFEIIVWIIYLQSNGKVAQRKIDIYIYIDIVHCIIICDPWTRYTFVDKNLPLVDKKSFRNLFIL